MDTNELYFVRINLFCYLSYDKKKTDAHIQRDKYILYHVNKFGAPAKVKCIQQSSYSSNNKLFSQVYPFCSPFGWSSSSYKNLIARMQKVQIVEILHLRKLPIAINYSYVITFLALQYHLIHILSMYSIFIQCVQLES